ncbi:MAG: Ig-like domain-containing protein [Aeoliella sp.]
MKSSRPFNRKRPSRDRRPIRQRSLRVETLEGRYLLDGDGITVVGDQFHLNQNGPQVELDVLANDLFDDDYTGDLLITSVSFGSEGGRIGIAEEGQSIHYTPPADFEGTETFVYAVDGEHTGLVSVSLRTPVADDGYEIPPDGSTRELDVLGNDPFWDGYAGDRIITSVSVASGGGEVEIAEDGRSILYTSGSGSESFVYVVDDLYPARVKIEIPDTLENDDYVAVRHDPPRTLYVLANDPFWQDQYNGERKITHVTESSIGAEITIADDGRSILYTQPADFADRAAWSHI